jgi:molybdopterin/thiamine biosynthesis adenylyltransferase
MPDSAKALLKARHDNAVARVKAELESDSTFTCVPPSEALPLLKICSAVWRKVVSVKDTNHAIEIGLTKEFPDEAPVAVVTGWQDIHLTNPHILNGGLICVIPSSAAIDSNNPAGLVKYVFSEVEEILKGTSSNDFREEFSYYWGRRLTNGDQKVLIIDPIEKLENPFPAIFCKGFVCVASSVERLNRWASNWTGSPSELKTEDLGVFIHLKSPLLPSEYPNSLADLLSLASAHDPSTAKIIKDYLVKSNGRGLALLVQDEAGGVALGGVIFDGLNLSKSIMVPGFRAGRASTDLVLKTARQVIASASIRREAVTRADHRWIHSRGGDGRDLSKKSILLIGCGSLGGYVAHLLSRAGVGSLTITDNDFLGWANVGRHILGASSIGRWKAEAMAEAINRELPHLDTVGIPKDWRTAFASDPEIFAKHDLVVSVTADWRCERPLNILNRDSQMPPILFGWLEPHAVAGHCLVVSKNGGCLECGVNTFGQFMHKVATFDTTTISKEPGACTHYQQYGPTALMPVASMIASVATESLLSFPTVSTLNSWISSEDHFKSLNANISEDWAEQIGGSEYSRTFRKTWNKSKTCAVCLKTAV